MSYQTYTTEAVVCGSKVRNTADRSYLLFTELAGMVYASARSVREERSKQRYALQEFSLVRVSLVKSKQGWRIGSVEALDNFYTTATTRVMRAGVSSLIQITRRFVVDEDPQPAVYRDLRAALGVLPSVSSVPLLTEHFTLRLLTHLGYISADVSTSVTRGDADWTQSLDPLPKQAQQAIERGFAASHL